MDLDDSPAAAAHIEYFDDLNAAQFHAQRALEALYSRSGPKRGFWYRMALARAQNTLMSLYMMEIRRKDGL